MNKKILIGLLILLLMVQVISSSVLAGINNGESLSEEGLTQANGDSFKLSASPGPLLPEPVHNNLFYVLPIWNNMGGASEEVLRQEFNRLKSQFGASRLYYRVGFSGFLSNSRVFKVAEEEGINIGQIIGNNQTHHEVNTTFKKNQMEKDIRNLQWRMDGVTWLASPNYPGAPIWETATEPRDRWVPTPSRYSQMVRVEFENRVRSRAKRLLDLHNNYPHTLAVVNGIVEEELALGGATHDNYLADYSPYAITEFRDWLRHTGMYDADTGKYAGQGASHHIIGAYVNINGKMRSQFYDDSAPNNANGTGQTFNQRFGTSFTKWTLKYYDLDAYPDPIPYSDDPSFTFNPAPQSGHGFTAGGFDAPRQRQVSNAYWKAWSWDVIDQGNNYPPGNPTNPAFGFRQQMVSNWIQDIFSFMIDEGLPLEMMYPHQIPSELITATRDRSSASPIWTGLLKANNNIGLTRFGSLDVSKITQYSNNWGLFEWHPQPGAVGQQLYDRTMADLNLFKNNGGHIFFSGWWYDEAHGAMGMRVDDTTLGTAVKDFYKAQQDRPFWEKNIDEKDYVPPAIHNVIVSSGGNNTHRVMIDKRIWENHDSKWEQWSQFSHFIVSWSKDDTLPLSQWETINTSRYSVEIPNREDGETYYYNVRAVSKAGKRGEWGLASFSGPSVNGERITIVGADSGESYQDSNPTNSYDGNINTYWSNIDSIDEAWIEYDVGSIHKMLGLKIILNHNKTRTYPIKVEVDGVEVFNGSSDLQTEEFNYQVINFSAVNGRYIKIIMTEQNSNSSNILSIKDFEVYGRVPKRTPVTIDSDWFDAVKTWEFTNDAEGWIAANHISGFSWQSGGYIGGNVSGGSDPHIMSPDNLGVNITGQDSLIISMKNSTTSNLAEIFWQTPQSDFDQNKYNTFNTVPLDESSREYWVPMSHISAWTGTLKRLRIDPSTDISNGSFDIDYVRIGKIKPRTHYTTNPSAGIITSAQASSVGGTNNPANTYDGNTVTKFRTGGGDWTEERWIEYTLDDIYMIEQVKILFDDEWSPSTKIFPIRIEVNGQGVWQGNSLPPKAGMQVFDIDSTPGDSVRIVMTAPATFLPNVQGETNNDQPSNFTISEVEFLAEIHDPEKAAENAVLAYENAPITTLEQVAQAETLETQAVALVAVLENLELKGQLETRITTRKVQIDAAKVVLEAEAEAQRQADAEAAVVAYEEAPLNTLAEVLAAELLQTAAEAKVALVQDKDIRATFEARIVAHKILVDVAKGGFEQSPLYGDVNGDSKVTNVDLILLKRYIAGIEVENFNEENADVNGDDKITNVDLILLIRYLAGIIHILGP